MGDASSSQVVLQESGSGAINELKAEVERGTGAKGEQFLRLDFVNDRVLVISTEEAERAHGRIMAKHRVPSRMSPDLVE